MEGARLGREGGKRGEAFPAGHFINSPTENQFWVFRDNESKLCAYDLNC